MRTLDELGGRIKTHGNIGAEQLMKERRSRTRAAAIA
jgi:hypothetical protein